MMSGKVYKDLVGSAYYVAPEVLQRNYGKEIDVWSAGVILYILLCGTPPFWEGTKNHHLLFICFNFYLTYYDLKMNIETEKGIFDAILKGEVDIKTSPWNTISESAKDLVLKMLTKDPKKRITAAQALG